MRKLSSIMMLLSLFALAGCGENYSWNQKITVTVDTPTGEVSGSSVQQVRARFGQIPSSANEVNYDQTGEAVVVHLGKGKYLFALLSGPELAWGAYRDRLPKANGREAFLQKINKMKGAVEINPRLLVTFTNIKKPETVKRVDPSNLAATFGRGYALKSITLEITDEPVTTGKVESVLVWLKWSREKLLAAGGGENPVALPLSEGGIDYLGRTEFRTK